MFVSFVVKDESNLIEIKRFSFTLFDCPYSTLIIFECLCFRLPKNCLRNYPISSHQASKEVITMPCLVAILVKSMIVLQNSVKTPQILSSN